MKRREFVTLLGGAAAWPIAAHAQQGERIRRIGVLMNVTAEDVAHRANIAAFRQAMAQKGWTDGRNVTIDVRWSGGDVVRLRQDAEEMLGLAPDVLVAGVGGTTPVLQQLTRAVPIVFTQVVDPVGAGFVDSLARPGGNATGFTSFEFGLSGKWLELLKEIAPGVTRAAIIRDPTVSAGIGQFAAIASVAPSLGVDVRPVNVSDPDEIERVLGQFARSANVGLIVTGSAFALIHRGLIVQVAQRHKLPAVYYERSFVAAGGMISYGSNYIDQ
jgi:putative ABC transport system substrate-binding protein